MPIDVFGKYVLPPASTIQRVDRDNETVYVRRTKGQFNDAPECEREKQPRDPGYLEQFAKYYGMPHV